MNRLASGAARRWTGGAVLLAGLVVTIVVGAWSGADVGAQATIIAGPQPTPSVPATLAPGLLWVIFRPGTPLNERADAHTAAGGVPGPEQQFGDGPIAMNVTVPVGTEQAALQVYRARASVVSAAGVPRLCPMPRPTPPPGTSERVMLVQGCNNVTLTWPNGTPVQVVMTGLDSSTALVATWRWDAPDGRFLGWSPLPNAPNDLTAVNRGDAVFVCVNGPTSLNRPVV